MGLADYEHCDYTVLSLGAGIQSSAVAIMAHSKTDYGIPEPDEICFADTGNEPSFVYSWLETLTEWLESRGGSITVVQRGDLWSDLKEKVQDGERFASIPAWTPDENGDERPLRRQCTREYKIEPIQKHIRRKLGYKRGQVMKGKVLVGIMLGISTDEVSRASQNSRTSWTHNLFPLLDQGYTRNDCHKVFKDHGLPVPKKSSCVFCPYHSQGYWRDLKENHPEEFQDAVEFDRLIRDLSMEGSESKIYVHRSCQPLEEVDLSRSDRRQEELFSREDGFQGSCGSGFCGT